MAITYSGDELEIPIIARAITRRAAPFPPERHHDIIGPAILAAAARHFGTAAVPSNVEMVDFIDALTMAV